MAQVKDVSGTAFVVAEFRAEENRQADTAVPRSSGRTVSGRGQQVRGWTRRGQLSHHEGSRQDSHQISRRHAREAPGFGLPTGRRPRRRPGHPRRAKPVDGRDLLRDRRCGDAEAETDALPAAGHRCQRDVHSWKLRNGWIDALAETERISIVDLPTYFIWEGNTMYLPFASIRHTLAEIRTHVTRFRVSFDYMADAVITKTTGDPGITKLVDSFANMGAPWRVRHP